MLQDKLLQYYLNEEDPVARGQLLLDGCRVQPLRDGQTYSVKRDGESVPLFPFSITHPDSSQAYHLATTSEQETDEWMRALQVGHSRMCGWPSINKSKALTLLGHRPSSSPL